MINLASRDVTVEYTVDVPMALAGGLDPLQLAFEQAKGALDALGGSGVGDNVPRVKCALTVEYIGRGGYD